MRLHADVLSTPNVPALAELQARPHWVCWRKEQRQGKLTKVPYDAITGRRAKANNPQTWTGYAQAVQALHTGTYHGIGYMFQRDYTGIDLDQCVSEDGRIESWARAYLDRLPSYAEYSPSKTGIHILVRGIIPSGTRRPMLGALHPQAAIEMYCERRYFTVTGHHVEGTPTVIEACHELLTIYAEITAPIQKKSVYDDERDDTAWELSDDALLDKALQARNGATFGALWEGDTSGYGSQSEAEVALCNLLAFWTGKDAYRMDRIFRRSALYRPEKWDRAARSGETYGEGTIARAIASCSETYHPQRQGTILQFRRGLTDDQELRVQLPETDLDFVLDCLRDEEEGDARLYAYLFRGKCIYDHTEGTWYEWRGTFWERDECKHSLLLASGPLASAYLDASAHLSEEAAQEEKKLDPELLKRKEPDAQQEHYQSLKAMTGELIGRAKALKRLKRAQAVLTYAQAYLKITSRQWDTHPWLLGTREGVLDLRTGTLCDGQPEEYIRTVIPTIWSGLDEPAPRFEQYLREIFADREDSERVALIAFLQRALGYGITGIVTEHIFLMLLGEEGRNGKDTLMTLLTRVLGNVVGAVSNDVIIASGKYTTPGSAKPHLCALQGKRMAWASETSKGARFDVGQVKFLTGGGSIPARQLYGHDYTFDPSHLLILLTNHKPHADAQDSAFWDRLCPIIFTLRFVDHPAMPNERQKDRNLGQTLEQEASGILAWLVRGCLMWQREGLAIPPSVLQARQEYREEENTLGQFIKECCVIHEQARVKASRLYERYKEWAQDNNLKAMNGNTFGLEMKKLYAQKRANEGNVYCGIGLLDTSVPRVYPQDEDLHTDEAASEGVSSTPECEGSVGSVPTFRKVPYRETQKVQKESLQEVDTLPTLTLSIQEGIKPPVEDIQAMSIEGQKGVKGGTHNQEWEEFII